MKSNTKWTVGLLSLGLAGPRAGPDRPGGRRPPKEPAGRQRRPARPGPGPPRRPRRHAAPFQQAVEKLNLSADQKTKVNAAFADAKEKVQKAVTDAGSDPAAAREKVRPIVEDLRNKVNEVLTQEQKDQMQKAREARGGGRRGNGNGGGDPKPPQPEQK